MLSFLTDAATTEIYTLSLHDALPIFECLAARSDLAELLAPLNDDATARCVAAERAFSRALSGSCNVPLGAYAELEGRSEEHTSELQSQSNLVCRLLLEKKNKTNETTA